MEKLRAVIYSRCSTEEESQKDALIKQVQESEKCVYEHGWQLIDTYVEAKSGTTIKGRDEYNRLYHELESDKFDIIVIKSQDRLMRNTRDWYLFLDRMLQNGKRLFMYLEHKFYTTDDALITGIKAILAEEYSRELSKKVNNAHQNRQREGKRFVFTNKIYGYRKTTDKSIVIDEKEAEMIQMIYRLSADGYGTYCSAEILFQNGYRNREGNRISPSIIRNIIRNPLYKGTVIQNRQHYDFDSRQVIKNPPSKWQVHENAVPAIIDEELFDRANQGMDARKQKANREGGYIKIDWFGRYELSGRLFCGLCKNPFYRTVRKNKSGKVVEWKCSNYLQNGRKRTQIQRNQIRKVKREEGTGCDNIHLDEKKFFKALELFFCKENPRLELQRKCLIEETMTILEKAINGNDGTSVMEGLEETLNKTIRQKDILLQKLLDEVISDEEFKIKNKELEERRTKAEDELKRMTNISSSKAEYERRMEWIRKKLEENVTGQAQRTYVVEKIAKIEVFPAWIEVYFDKKEEMGMMAETFLGASGNETNLFSSFCIPQICSTSKQPKIEEQKQMILELMRENPTITAKKIAGKMEVSLSLVNRRICNLKKEGKVRYSSPNGKGEWIILPSNENF